MPPVIGGASTGAALAMLLSAVSGGLGSPPPRVEIPAASGAAYELQESADRRRLLIRWQGVDQTLGECHDRLLQRLQRGGRVVSVVERNCGATVDYATQVLIDGGRRGVETLAVFQGRPQVQVAWNGRRLQVSHPRLPAARVFRRLQQAGGVEVFYVALGPAPTPTAQGTLDESSRNYGAHGRALGLPDEVLLRWAGWAQQASGLHRGDWGRWSGAAPYGDDPRGSQLIRDGMKHSAQYAGDPG